MNPADIAREAARIVQERGLRKGGMGHPSGDGPVCLWGGLRAAGVAFYGAEYEAHFRAAIADRFPDSRYTIFPGADWNDRPETTVEDVAKLLLQVADDIEFGDAR